MGLVGCIGLAGSGTLAGAGLFSATRGVIAVMANDLFVGDAVGNLSGAGTLAIRSQKDPAFNCVGQFTSSAEAGGAGQMQCSDGSTATFRFRRLSVYQGYGIATFGRGPMSFAYGLSVADSVPYLNLPEGKRLAHNGVELALIDP